MFDPGLSGISAMVLLSRASPRVSQIAANGPLRHALKPAIVFHRTPSRGSHPLLGFAPRADG
jgi:hypothetical protein